MQWTVRIQGEDVEGRGLRVAACCHGIESRASSGWTVSNLKRDFSHYLGLRSGGRERQQRGCVCWMYPSVRLISEAPAAGIREGHAGGDGHEGGEYVEEDIARVVGAIG